MKRLCIAVAALGALLARTAHAEEPRAIPRYRLPGPEAARTSPDWKAVQGGSVLLGVGYGAALTVGALQNFHGDTPWLAVPVAGPWATLAFGTTLNEWGLALDGIAQLGGAALVTAGFVYPRRVLGPARGALRLEHVALARQRRSGAWALELGGSF